MCERWCDGRGRKCYGAGIWLRTRKTCCYWSECKNLFESFLLFLSNLVGFLGVVPRCALCSRLDRDFITSVCMSLTVFCGLLYYE